MSEKDVILCSRMPGRKGPRLILKNIRGRVFKEGEIMIDKSQYNESKPLDMHNLQFDIAAEHLAL